MRRVAGKNRFSSACLGLPAGALPGEPAHAVQVWAPAAAGTAKATSIAAAAMTSDMRRMSGSSPCVGWGGEERGGPHAATPTLTRCELACQVSHQTGQAVRAAREGELVAGARLAQQVGD